MDGARVAFDGLRPVIDARDPGLAKTVDARFSAVQKLLDRHRRGADGFVGYDELSPAEVRALSDAVTALNEPLSKVTAAVVG